MTRSDTRREGGSDGFAFGVVVFLVVALACGGASASPTSAAIVRLAAVPVLAFGLWRLSGVGVPPGAKVPLMILIAAAIVILIQLVPLPPSVWSVLPGHAIAAEVYRTAGIAAPWLPISLVPSATYDVLLGLIPPAATLVASLTLRGRQRRMLVWAVLATALASVGLGILQMAGGPESPLRLYAVNNPESAIGFFANRNHQGDFLALTLPLAAFLAARRTNERGPPPWFRWVALAGYALVVVVGAATTGSRAALGLILVGVVGSALVIAVTRSETRERPRWASLYMPGMLALAGAGILTLALDPALESSVTARTGPEVRLELTPRVAAEGLDFAPFGAGAGTFIPVYRMLEPQTALHSSYTNHAHDDYVEVWLEAGVAGAALLAAFVIWWTMASWRALGEARRPGLVLAGSVVVGMLLIHSLVDYPLRTPALAVLAAFASGLMLEARRNPGLA